MSPRTGTTAALRAEAANLLRQIKAANARDVENPSDVCRNWSVLVPAAIKAALAYAYRRGRRDALRGRS